MNNDRLSQTLGELGRSAFLQDMQARGGKGVEFLKFLGSGLLGVLGGLIATFLGVAVVAIAAFFIIALSGGDLSVIGKLLSDAETGIAPTTLSATVGAIAFLAVINTTLMVVIVLLASLIRRRRFWNNITAARRFRWGQLFVGLLLYGIAFSAMIAVEALFFDFELAWPVLDLTDNTAEIVLLSLGVTAGFILAAFAEEILFRGWLLRETSVFTRRLVIILLVNAVLFAAVHFDPTNFPYDPNAFIARAIMGAVFCYMTLRFAGIEFSTGAHAANNILITLIIQPMSFSEPPAEPVQVDLMLESLVLLVMGVAVTEAAARLKFLKPFMGETPKAEPNPFD